MTNTIYIASHHGKIDEADRGRAIAAAEDVLAAYKWKNEPPVRIDPVEAFAAYQRWIDSNNSTAVQRDRMLATAWVTAEVAANLALTEHWHDPEGASVELGVYKGGAK